MWCYTHYPLDEPCEVRRQSLGTLIYSYTWTKIHLNMRSKMIWRNFAYEFSVQQSYVGLHKIYLYRSMRGRGGSELEIRAHPSKILPDINWLTRIMHSLKISIVFFLKYSSRFLPGFSVINIQIAMDWRNLPKLISGYLILLLISTIMSSLTKIFVRNSTNSVRSVKTLMNYFFISSSFTISSWQPDAFLWYMPFHFYTNYILFGQILL